MKIFWVLLTVTGAIWTAAAGHGGWATLFGILILIDVVGETEENLTKLINQRADEILAEMRKKSSV